MTMTPLRRSALRSAVLLATVVAAAAITLRAQQPAPQGDTPPLVFRAETNYVEVDAVVTDAQGQPVAGLTQNDFEVLEQGKPQKIATFALVDVPIERPERPLLATQPIEIDVQTNTPREGRVYLLVLDDLHTDVTRTPRVKAAARRFVERNFGANDIGAVVFTGSLSTQSQDFTSMPALLLRAIDKFQGQKLRSATLNQLDNPISLSDGNGGSTLDPGPDADAIERPFRARRLMNALRVQSEFLSGVRGRRKAILLFSEGVDYDINEVIDTQDFDSVVGKQPSQAIAVLEDTRDAVAAATRANVVIYAIDPRGLTTGTDDLIGSAYTLEEQNVGVRSSMAEQRLARDSLNTLAADTGGFAVTNSNLIDPALDRIVRENSAYYLLGYYPENDKRDGKFRRIQVRVKRPGLQVRARNGYIAPRGKAPAATERPTTLLTPALLSAVASPLPVSGIPLKVFAAPFRGPSAAGSSAPTGTIALAVELDASALEFTEKQGGYTETFQVVTQPTDTSNKRYQWDRRDVTLTVKPEGLAKLRSRGVRVLTKMDLPPGRYQLRVAAGDAAGKTGSVVYDVEVPDYTKVPLAMSGIAMTSLGASEMTTVRAVDPLADFLPGPLSATREFRTGDIVTTFTEVYENVPGAPAHKVAVTAQLLADGGQVVWENHDERSSAELDGAKGGYGFNHRIPLSDVTPGLYVLRIAARQEFGARAAVSRDIQIRVR